MGRLNSGNDGRMSVGDDSLRGVERTPPPSPSPSSVNWDVVYVALGKDYKGNESVLMYAVEIARARNMNICVLHVHQLDKLIPIMGTRFLVSSLQEENIHHEKERKEMHKILDKYVHTCEKAKVEAKKLCIEMDSIEKGILQLISVHGIKWLVMGAAADTIYSRKIKSLKSKKAIHVCREAPSLCQIWFVYKGNLVYTRESRLDGVNEQEYRPSSLASPSTASTISMRSPSTIEGENDQNVSTSSGGATPFRTSEAGFDFDGLSGRTPSVGSHFFQSSSELLVEQSSVSSFSMTEVKIRLLGIVITSV